MRALDEALGPAGLLGLEGGHLDGELGGALDVLEVFELPALELRAIAEVGVFGEGVVLPAAGFVDGLATPHAGGAVEVEEDAGAGAATVLEDEVAVEEDGFDLRQEAVVAIEVGPAGLDHANAGLGEVVDDAAEPAGRRDEVGVEDGDELALGGAETFFERAGFVAVAVGAVEVVDGLGIEALGAGGEAGDHGAGHVDGLVGGVVEELDLEAVAGIVEAAAGVDEAVDDELLVVDGELDGDEGEIFFGEGGGGRRSGTRCACCGSRARRAGSDGCRRRRG